MTRTDTTAPSPMTPMAPMAPAERQTLSLAFDLGIRRRRCGARLEIVQSGFAAEQKREFGGAHYGWTHMGQQLVDLLARMA